MLNNFVMPDLYPAAPEVFLLTMACVLILVESLSGGRHRSLMAFLTEATLVGCLVITFYITFDVFGGQTVYTFNDLFVEDFLAATLKFFTYIAVLVVLIYSRGYLAARNLDKGEFYLLVIFATLGMMVMISAASFLSVYLGLEMLSLSLYALVAVDRDSARSTEAAMKYFVLGALASGLLLYGMSMIYGATGTLEIRGIAEAAFHGGTNKTILVFGLVFLVSGIAFKLGVVPFHMWIPDVYHGAPTAVTLFIASAPKLAALAMALRLLVYGLFDLATQWQMMLLIMAMLSIALGNLAAISQTNIKRMLAYSAISHMGFLVLALTGGLVDGDPSLAVNAYSTSIYYAVTYVTMSLAAFGMILLLSRPGHEAENLEDFKGLNKRSPWFAAVMAMVMFSMAGIPFFVGFMAKFTVLTALVAGNKIGVVIFAVAFSLIGAFYYLRVVKLMYFDEPVDTVPLQGGMDIRFLLSINGLAVALLGLFPDRLIGLCQFALIRSISS